MRKSLLGLALLALLAGKAFGQGAIVDSLGGASGNIAIGGMTVASQLLTTGQAAIVVPLTGNTVSLGNYNSLTIINPAGTLAALTVTLPLAMGQGQCAQVMFTQAITSDTVSPPTGFTIVGTAISAASTTQYTSYTYCLFGTVFYRTQ